MTTSRLCTNRLVGVVEPLRGDNPVILEAGAGDISRTVERRQYRAGEF